MVTISHYDIMTNSSENSTFGFEPLYDSFHLYLTSSILGFLILATIIGNVFVVAAIILEKNLQSVSNYLILSLAVADLMVATLVMPISALNEVSSRWWLGMELCDVWVCFDVLCCTASILHLIAIALDRYWAVTNVKYIHKRTAKRIIYMIIGVWIASIVISIPARFHTHRGEAEKIRVLVNGRCEINTSVGYTLFSTIGAFYLPMMFMIGIYIQIYRTARNRIRRKTFKKKKKDDDSVRSQQNKRHCSKKRHKKKCNLTDSFKSANSKFTEDNDSNQSFSFKSPQPPEFQLLIREATTVNHDNSSMLQQEFIEVDEKSYYNDISTTRPISSNVTTNEQSTNLTRSANSDQSFTTETPKLSPFMGSDIASNYCSDFSIACVEYFPDIPYLDEDLEHEESFNLRKLSPQFTPAKQMGIYERRLRGRLLSDTSITESSEAFFSNDSPREKKLFGSEGCQPLLTQRVNKSPHSNHQMSFAASSMVHVTMEVVNDMALSSTTLNHLNHSHTQKNKRKVRNQALASMLKSSNTIAATRRLVKPVRNRVLRKRGGVESASTREKLEQKRERKAARTLAIITGCFVLCWLPFCINALIRPFCTSCNMPRYVDSFFLWLGYVNSLLNPIIYTIFSPDFRNAFAKIFFARCCCNFKGRH